MEVAMGHKKMYCFVLGVAFLIAMPQQFIWAAGKAAPGKVAPTEVRTASPGIKVQAEYLNNPPTLTPEEARELNERWEEADRTGPKQPAHPAPMTTSEQRGPEMRSPKTPASTDFTVFSDSVIPSAGIAG